ncbi:hypothetical protein LSTR_LSTR001762 [Laodelphax striatellus]|uniref:Uncharacterized protein n=1 Tax=Laodelphax striatellus TaxID=195883 RepID=A0A482WFQ5_LAOST|nr:hypothetical protein LSTR_LSTR001762 [Laodelphax striatellus]
MSYSSFDELLEIVKDDLASSENFVRDSISPEEKLVITLRVAVKIIHKTSELDQNSRPTALMCTVQLTVVYWELRCRRAVQVESLAAQRAARPDLSEWCMWTLPLAPLYIAPRGRTRVSNRAVRRYMCT